MQRGLGRRRAGIRSPGWYEICPNRGCFRGRGKSAALNHRLLRLLRDSRPDVDCGRGPTTRNTRTTAPHPQLSVCRASSVCIGPMHTVPNASTYVDTYPLGASSITVNRTYMLLSCDRPHYARHDGSASWNNVKDWVSGRGTWRSGAQLQHHGCLWAGMCTRILVQPNTPFISCRAKRGSVPAREFDGPML